MSSDFPERSLTTAVAIENNFTLDPLSTYASLKAQFPGESFLLESVEGTKKTARYSFIGVDPVHTFRSVDGTVLADGEPYKSENPFESLRNRFKVFKSGTSELAPFSGGMVGYVGYGTVKYFEPVRGPSVGDSRYPDLYFVIPKHLVCFDHLNSRVILITHGKIADLRAALSEARPHEPSTVSVGEGVPNTSRDEFERMVSDAREHILDGDIFQVVLSRRVDFKVQGDSIEMYRALRTMNPSPYLFHLDFDGVQLLGSSPEMLVRLEGTRLTTRPLAGTRPRASDPEEDEKLKLEMLLDEKERAEHLMLVDLHRNDMGRVSRVGTVKVNELMAVEKYSHVQHIVSNVESEIHPDRDAFDALRACFPAGTVSGAPKVRAMQIISELERSPRGPYAGAVGYFDFTGNMDFAINIRSISVADGCASVQSGAGIVADSVPQREYEETEHKMRAMVESVRSIAGGGRK